MNIYIAQFWDSECEECSSIKKFKILTTKHDAILSASKYIIFLLLLLFNFIQILELLLSIEVVSLKSLNKSKTVTFNNHY